MIDIAGKFFSSPESGKQVTFHMQSYEHLL